MRYLSVESLRLMCDLLRERGLDASGLFDAAGVSPAQLLDPTVRIAGREELAAIRLFRQRAADLPALAVQIGQRYRLATFGSLGMAMLSAPTLADSLRAAMHYQALSFSWLRFEVALVGEQVDIQLDASQAPLDLRDFLLCRDVAAACAMLRDLAGDDVCLADVHLILADVSQADGLASYLGCKVFVGKGPARMSLPMSLLQRPNRHHSITAHALCLAACDAQIAAAITAQNAHQDRDASVKVESMLHRHPGRLLPHDEVAGMLGASERTLRRQLAREGTSYRDVRERVLRERAKALLMSTALSVADIAEQLGFADASTFCQAFRRWSGQTPSSFRKKAKPDELTYDLSSII